MLECAADVTTLHAASQCAHSAKHLSTQLASDKCSSRSSHITEWTNGASTSQQVAPAPGRKPWRRVTWLRGRQESRVVLNLPHESCVDSADKLHYGVVGGGAMWGWVGAGGGSLVRIIDAHPPASILAWLPSVAAAGAMPILDCRVQWMVLSATHCEMRMSLMRCTSHNVAVECHHGMMHSNLGVTKNLVLRPCSISQAGKLTSRSKFRCGSPAA